MKAPAGADGGGDDRDAPPKPEPFKIQHSRNVQKSLTL